jgi:hypothetical protein
MATMVCCTAAASWLVALPTTRMVLAVVWFTVVVVVALAMVLVLAEAEVLAPLPCLQLLR